MVTTQPEEFVSNLLSDAINSVVKSRQILDQIADRCAGWSLSYSLELQEGLKRIDELSGYLESLMSDAEAFDDATEDAEDSENSTINEG